LPARKDQKVLRGKEDLKEEEVMAVIVGWLASPVKMVLKVRLAIVIFNWDSYKIIRGFIFNPLTAKTSFEKTDFRLHEFFNFKT